MTDAGEALTRWTARGAFALYVAALMVRMQAGRQLSAEIAKLHDGRQRAAAPLLWTAACALMLAHVAFAFDSFHHWSHRAAYDDTARQTKELFGINWGGGIFFNYLLLLVWIFDVAWWWRDHRSYESRNRVGEWSIQGFLAFMWFNGIVVFGQGWMRWAGAMGFVALAIIAAMARRRIRRAA